jgi:hypothetical protein
VTSISRSQVLGAALILGFLAWLVSAGGELGLVVQFVLGKLAYSTSNGAALFLLGYGVLALWCLQLHNAAHSRWLAIFFAALFAGHVINLWITVRYLNEMGIPAGTHVYHWQGDHYSFTSLFHSHLGKTAFAAPAHSLGFMPARYDGGDVFLAWVPAWASWSIGIAFSISLFASLATLPSLAFNRSRAHVVMFAIAAALALRAMIDGGALAAGMPSAIAALAWVVLHGRGSNLSNGRLLTLVSVPVVAYLAFYIGLSTEMPWLGGMLFPACLYLWLGLVGSRRALSARVALIAVLTIFLALDAERNLLPLVRTLPADCRTIILTRPEPAEHPCAAETAFATYSRLGEDPRKPNAVLLEPEPHAGEASLSVRVLLVDADNGHFSPMRSGIWETIHLTPVTLADGWLAFSATARNSLPPVLAAGEPDAISHNNFNVYLWELARVFSQGGISEFILIPETQGNLRNPAMGSPGIRSSMLLPRAPDT